MPLARRVDSAQSLLPKIPRRSCVDREGLLQRMGKMSVTFAEYCKTAPHFTSVLKQNLRQCLMGGEEIRIAWTPRYYHLMRLVLIGKWESIAARASSQFFIHSLQSPGPLKRLPALHGWHDRAHVLAFEEGRGCIPCFALLLSGRHYNILCWLSFWPQISAGPIHIFLSLRDF